MSDEIAVPAAPSHDATPEQVREYVIRLHEWVSAREPLADGGLLDKFLTGRNAMDLGVASYSPGTNGVGSAGDLLIPGFGSFNPGDKTPPDPIAGLTVTPGPTFFFVEFEAPTYQQGGANGRTVVYSATYSGTGPLPTFGNAVEVFQCFGSATIAVIDAEPGSQQHFWVKAETRAGVLQASPTGGTNGVSATCGQIDGAEHIVALSIGTAQIADLAVTNAKIVDLSVAKLIAGSIGVGEYIQSTGFVTGSAGWQIRGDGVAEFSGVIVRGAIYATSGEFGGVTINGALTMNTSGHLKGGQTAYATGTGFFLGYSGGAYKFSIGTGSVGLTWDGSALTVSGTLSAGSSPAVSGTTMTGSGAVFNAAGTFAAGNSSKNISFNGTTLTINGDVVVTDNLVSEAVSANYISTVSEDTSSGADTDVRTVDIESSLATIDDGVVESFAILNVRVVLNTTNARWVTFDITADLYDSSDVIEVAGYTFTDTRYMIPTSGADNFLAFAVPQVFEGMVLGASYKVRYTVVASCYAGDSTLQTNMGLLGVSGLVQLINRKV